MTKEKEKVLSTVAHTRINIDTDELLNKEQKRLNKNRSSLINYIIKFYFDNKKV